MRDAAVSRQAARVHDRDMAAPMMASDLIATL
jgi:hypothetical protein